MEGEKKEKDIQKTTNGIVVHAILRLYFSIKLQLLLTTLEKPLPQLQIDLHIQVANCYHSTKCTQ